MGRPTKIVSLSLSFAFCFCILLLATNTLVSEAKLGNETDKLALLEFKSKIEDYSIGVLASWNDSTQFCQWVGVSCSLKHDKRVTSLDLSNQLLVGTLSPYLGNLSFLRFLNLGNNSFHGEIPSEVGHLSRLQNMNLSNNYLGGQIPINVSKCSRLVSLFLNNNHLVQQIPTELGLLSKLEKLSLHDNSLTGRVPASFGNLSSLVKMSVGDNYLEGALPDSLSKVKTLQFFAAGVNKLSGMFPSWFYNLSSLDVLAIPDNFFHGNLEKKIGLDLPNLSGLYLGLNKFTGTIPASLCNISNLEHLDLPNNNFTGEVPLNFGNLQMLQWLAVSGNQLGKYATEDLAFINSLTNCSKLWWLDIGYNQLGGQLPISITNLSTEMSWLTLGGNRIGGTIPRQIANLLGLTNLCLQSNHFTGNIPTSLGTLKKLTGLSLEKNLLIGQIPSSLGNLTQLSELDISLNSLEGTIPESLGNCKNLRIADISHNKLNGTIPVNLISIFSLSVLLNLSGNSFTGFLPLEVGTLKNLMALDVANNKLSGVIPSTLGTCMALEQLNLSSNSFQGNIPDLRQLKAIKFLDLSNNNLSGQIPKYLANLTSLQNLNLSFNNFEGAVPAHGVFKNSSAIELYGNNKHCGGIQLLRLHSCPRPENPKKHLSFKLILVIIITIFSVLMLASISICSMRKLKKVLPDPSFGPLYPKVTYEELYHATGGFSLDNVLGKGTFGTVYKGNMGPDATNMVAVKVLNLQTKGASKSFMAEYEALRNIRHRNLVKVITACSSFDFEGNIFKALVYEFMPNGSLETRLHPEDEHKQVQKLSYLQRINILIDVASSLLYLHHESQTPIVHCDLKPSNVLLDDELTARVSDFGLAKLLVESSKEVVSRLSSQFSSLGVKGTIGYAAQEYGMGAPISTRGDVDSYGILLLEILTGKRPTNDLFKDEFNLHKYVMTALPDQVMDIAEPSILYTNMIKEAGNDRGVLSISESDHNKCR